MKQARIVIKNGQVLTLTEAGPAFGTAQRVDVLVEDGKIAALGADLKVADAEVMDATDCIVMPGLIDTHRHVWQTALRGICHDDTLKGYMREIRFLRAQVYRPEDIYLGNWAGMLEAINAGITTVFDFSHCINTPEHATAAIEGLRDAGGRAIFGYGFNDVPLRAPHFKSVVERCADLRRVRRDLLAGDDALVTMGAATSDLVICGIEQFKRELEEARALGLPVSIHSNTWEFPERQPEVSLMHEHGLLGPDLLYVHTNLSSDDEIQMIVDSGGAIASTPETEMQMSMGPSVIGRFMKAGGLPTFGCDIISNNSGDLLVQARLAMQTQRMFDNAVVLAHHEGADEVLVTTRDMLRAMTVNAAAAVGLTRRVGTLAPGKDADLILVRLDDINTMPLNDPVATLLLHAHPGNVDTVMVAGRVLKRAGKLTADLARARRLMAQSQSHIVAAIGKTATTLPGGYKAD